MFYKFGKFIYRRRWWVIGCWAIILAVSIPFVPHVTEPLKVGGFANNNLEAERAGNLLSEKLGYSASNLVIFYQSDSLTSDDPKFQQQVEDSVAGLKNNKYVSSVLDYTINPRQVSGNKHVVYEVVSLNVDPETATKSLAADEEGLKTPPDLKMTVGGGLAFFSDVEYVTQKDLERAELVAFPVAIIALLLVFGSVVAAGLPVLVGGTSVLVILAIVFGLGNVTELSIFVLNLATLLGLGLGLDYSLFITSRYREELERGHDVEEAVALSIATAGKAVVFSGLTVLIGLTGLLTFNYNFLNSVGKVGIFVVLVAGGAAVTLLPAVLGVAGHNINALSIRWIYFWRRKPTAQPPKPEFHFWAWLAHLVMRRPASFFVVVLIVLLAVGAPFLSVRFSSPNETILPPTVQSRQAYDLLVKYFNQSEIYPITLAITTPQGNILSPDNIYYLYQFTHELQQDPNVERVDSITTAEPRLNVQQYQTIYQLGDQLQNPYLSGFLKQFAKGDTTLISIVTKKPPLDPDTEALMAKIRNTPLPNGLQMLVGGQTAGVVDTVGGIYSNFPFAVTLIVISTYVVLLILLRSIVLPLKALVMNALSITASYGALVFIFQEGHFSDLLNFQALGFIEPTLPVIMFCTLFGLSMDYEVFLLSRIKEHFDQTGDNTASVAIGLQRSGKIITSAALVVVVVSLSFVAADIVLVKALGIGLAVAVFLDATLVRALLVPSTMRLLGHWNWYAPRWLLKILPETRLEGDKEATIVEQSKDRALSHK